MAEFSEMDTFLKSKVAISEMANVDSDKISPESGLLTDICLR